MKYLFILLFLALSTGQLFRLTILPGVTIFPHDLVITLMLVYFLLKGEFSFKVFKKEPIIVPLYLFSFLSLVSLVLNPLKISFSEILVSVLYLIRFIFYFFLFFLTKELLRKKIINTSQIIYGLLGTGIATGFLGFLQLILYPNIRNIAYLGWDPHFGRLVSTHLDPNFTGMILVFGLIIVTALLTKENQFEKRHRYFLYGSLALFFIALIFTWSRSSYLAFLVGSFVVLYKRKLLKFFVLLVVCLAILVLSIPKPSGEGGKLTRQSTADARLGNWMRSIDLFSKQPIFGYGFNTLRFLNLKTSLILPSEFDLNHSAGGVDNSLLFVLVTTGVAGFLAYVWLLLKMTKEGGLIFLASLLGLSVHALFQNSLFYSFNLIWLWLLYALVL